MKHKTIVPLLILMLFAPLAIHAQGSGISKDALKNFDDGGTVYVNTKAPGVHKEYDEKYGGYVWKDGMGSYICKDKNMKPLHDIDKDYYFSGTNNDPDNPKASYNVKKVWDEDRGCYVWKDDTGNFVGRDKPSADKQKDWLAQKDQDWLKNGTAPGVKGKPSGSSTAKKDDADTGSADSGTDKTESKGDSGKTIGGSSDVDMENLIIESDAQLAKAEAALNEAKAAIKMAKAQGINIDEYFDTRLIKQAEDKINEYKRKRNMMK